MRTVRYTIVLLVLLACPLISRAQLDSLSARLLAIDREVRAEVGLRLQEVVRDLVGIEAGDELPESFALFPAYPNPFDKRTRIRFQVPEAVHARIEVYDLLGRRVGVLFDRKVRPGEYEVAFRAGNLASGLYFYRLKAGDFVKQRKVLLIR